MQAPHQHSAADHPLLIRPSPSPQTDCGTSRSTSTSCDLASMRYRRLQPDEDPEGDVATFNLVVMEVRL